MNQNVTPAITLSQQTRDQIDHWVAKFPAGKQRSAVIMALRLAQDEHSYLTEPVMHSVADYLAIPKAYIYEVATFYTMYHLEPHGRYVIGICDSISCVLCGAKQLTEYVESALGVKVGQTTEDGMFTLKYVECLAACCGAPAILVNDHHYHENMTTEKVDALLAVLRNKEDEDDIT